MTQINYDFTQNTHTAVGPATALPIILEGRSIQSILDVGCGPGTWLAAAEHCGLKDLHGIDGIKVAPEQFHSRTAAFSQINLTQPFTLGRKFDLVLCCEVAEHLPVEAADILVSSLCAHADLIAFSAAAPGQPGQQHITCEWPAFWQEKFNRCGYACEDSVRWKLWDMQEIEPWYRQNLFLAHRDPAIAGKETRIPSVLHPALFEAMLAPARLSAEREMENSYYSGTLSSTQYAILFIRALRGKIGRRFAG